MIWAALLGVAAGLWAGVARADPPPLVVPSSSSASAAPATPAAPATAPDMENLHIQFDRSVEQPDGSTAYGTNRPVIVQIYGFRLYATQVFIPSKDAPPTAKVEASGEVELTNGAMRVLMRKAAVDAEKNAIVAQQIRMGKAPAYVDGEVFAIGAEHGEMTNATIFFGEPDPYGLNIKSNNATIDVQQGEVTLHGATLRLGSVPFFYLPSYTQGRTDEPPLSLQAHFGFRKDLGGYAQTTSYWTQNPEFQPGMLLDEYSKRGPLLGPALKYNFYENPDWQQYGRFQSGFIRDHGNRGLDITGNAIPENRFFIDWQHVGTVGGVLDVNSSMSWWRDSYTVRDFRQSDWRDNQLPDNYVEVSHREQNALASAFIRYRPNNFEIVQERLPETRLDYFATPLGITGIYQEGSVGYVQLIQPNFNGTPTLHSNRFDGYYGWRRPVSINNWATFTPVAGTRITQYQDTLGQRGDFTRMLGQVGFDSEMRAVGRWDYTNPTWGINGIQHVVRPVAMYRYIPAAQQGSGLIPVIDQDLTSNYPPVFDLGDTRSIDSLHSQNVLRYGVENTLQTRAADYGSRDLASFNIYNDVHFQRAAGQQDFSDVWTGVGLDPARWLHLQVYDRLDPTAFTNREVRTSAILNDGDRWTVSLNTSTLQHQVDQFWTDVQYRVSERIRLYGRWRFDEHFGGLTEQFYGLRERLGEAWDFEYGIAYYRGTGNQNGIGFNVKLILLAD
jgi:LPS-assembly protein